MTEARKPREGVNIRDLLKPVRLDPVRLPPVRLPPVPRLQSVRLNLDEVKSLLTEIRPKDKDS